MKCDEVQNLLPDYWDWPEGDWNRLRVDEHVKHCACCAEEFQMWRESTQLIQKAGLEEDRELASTGGKSMSSAVMDRIYSEESWRLPVAERIYSIPNRVRVRLLTFVAGCLALFGCAFLYQLISPDQTNSYKPSTGVTSVGALGGEGNELSLSGMEGIPVASIGDPIVLGLSTVNTYPNYLFVLSLLGLICTLLIMNWLARIRA